MELLTLKILALVLLVCVRLCAGLGPLSVCRLTCRSPWVDLGVALCLSLAGGILLATCFIHLVPQVRAALVYLLPEHSLPITELLIVAGFFFTFFLDEALISFRSSSKVYPQINTPSDSPSPSLSPQFLPTFTTRPHNILRCLLVSLHSLAKGMAVGLADSRGDVVFLTVATAVHESIAMVWFTLHLMKLDEILAVVVILNLVAAVFMVIGMVVGILLTSIGLDDMVVAVVRGIAAGNILYVTFYELLTREIRARAMGLLSHFLALMGFLVMLVLQLIGIPDVKYTQGVTSCIQSPSEEPNYENTDNSYPDPNSQDYTNQVDNKL